MNRLRVLTALLPVVVVLAASQSARADLIGNGTNTVSTLFYLGATSAPAPPYTNPAPSEIEDYQGPMGPTNSPPPTIPVHFLEGAIDLSTIDVGDTTITITNLAPPATPFCTVTTTPCPDRFTGFAFTFSSGVDITDVTVDPMSAADFRPNTTAPHDGLQLLSPTDFIVDVTGDAPATNDRLIFDVSTAAVVSSVPEPASWTLLAIGLLGLLAIERRFARRSGATGASS